MLTLALPFPAIDPVLIEIGPFAIRWYALAYVAGILLGWCYVTGMVRNPGLWERRPPPASVEQIDDLILWITLGVIVGVVGVWGHQRVESTAEIFEHAILELVDDQ